MLKLSGVYKIENTLNGKIYVGSAVDFDSRWRQHLYQLGNNKHHSVKLQRAWNKYGGEAFVFLPLEVVEDMDQLLAREQHWLDELKAVKCGYNICSIAGNTLGLPMSEENKIKMSKLHKGIPKSLETREKMSNYNSNGRVYSQKTLDTLASHREGRVVTAEHRAKISASSKGRVFSDEHKALISAGLVGRVLSEESRAKMSATIKAGMTPERRAKYAKAKTGVKWTPESRAKRMASNQAKRLASAK